MEASLVSGQEGAQICWWWGGYWSWSQYQLVEQVVLKAKRLAVARYVICDSFCQ